MVNLKEISDIKSIATSYKSCKFTEHGSCILEARFGKITLSVPDLKNTIIIKAKKISGNGRISINGTPYIIQSKISDQLQIPINEKVLDIQRPADALGEISILSLAVCFNSEGETLKKKWKNLITKCGDYKFVRMVNDRLYASTGAFFTNGKAIQRIETLPPGMSYLDGSLLKFSGPCEITDIIIDGDDNKNGLFNEFVHMESPGPNIFSNIPSTSNPFESRLKAKSNMHFIPSNSGQNQSSQERQGEFMNMLYNSDVVREFSAAKHTPDKSGLTKYLKSNGKDYLIIKRGGIFTLPISNLQPNSEYLVQVTVQKLNGNGKIKIGTFSNNTFVGEGCLVENSVQDKSIKITTSSNPYNKLQVRIMEDGVGEILISKIMVFSKDSNETAYSINYPAVNHKSSKKFVIVIPSYKNVKWCEKNIKSVIDQNYNNYRVIYTDDNSPDGTFEKVHSIVNASNKANKFTIHKNTTRLGALENLYNMITSCDDDEIILTLDGDDWLADDNVLNTLNNYYSKEDVWMTYGQYKNYPDNGIGIARKIPDDVIQTKSYRKYSWCSSHLRTFYAWLFKKIKIEDLKYEGNFMAMTWDMTIMFPMLEMAGTHSRFISDILYIYNLENPINDHKVNVALQQKLDHYVRNMNMYDPLPSRPVFKTNIGLLIISTGKYDRFVPGLISSADNYFLNDPSCKVTYYLFTDKEQKIKSNRNVVQIFVEHKKFPFASMDRFKNFTKNASMFAEQDYLYYVDVDSLFVDHVSKEILGNLVGVRHCGFVNKRGPYETNPSSVFYVDESYPKKYKYYFGGGFSGGRRNNYLALSSHCYDMIEKDIANGIIPLWHDETAINKYFLDNEPDVILNPSYHYPQANEIYYKQGWAPENFEPKILLLDKEHKDIR